MKKISLLITAILFAMPLSAQIQFSLPDTNMVEGEDIKIPVFADSTLTGKGILSVFMEVNFNSTYVKPTSISTDGTLLENWSVSPNLNNDNRLIVAAAGTEDLSGSGVLFYIHFTAQNSGNAYISFNSNETYLNEGEPELIFEPGNISISQLPTINIGYSPSEVVAGDSVQFSVSGAEGDIEWSTTNPGIASIDDSGLLKALSYGMVEVVAEDSRGITDTSNTLKILGFSINGSDTTNYQGQEVSVDIEVSDLTNLGIESGSFFLNASLNDQLELLSVEKGALLEDNANITTNPQSNGISVAFAQIDAIEGEGSLLTLHFKLDDNFTSYKTFSFQDVIFNEAIEGQGENFTVRSLSLPSLNISPSSGSEVLVGETLQFEISNNTGAVSWSVSNSNLASINSDGLFSATKGGEVQITAEDSIGATSTTGNFNIYDLRSDLPDTSMIISDTLYFPVPISNMEASNSQVSANDLTINYNDNNLTYLGFSTEGSLTEGWSYSENQISEGEVRLVGAGANAFSSSGDMVYLKFKADESLSNNAYGNVDFEEILLNEGTPNITTSNGQIYVSTEPLPPELLYPANNEQNIPLSFNLNWSNGVGAETYDVQLSTSSSFSMNIVDATDVSATNLGVSGLEVSTNYYWRVRSVNNSGDSGWSSYKTFKTEDPLPTTPVLNTPDEGVTDVSLETELNWSSSDFAINYRVEIDTLSNFSGPVTDTTIVSTSFTISDLSYDKTYYWRIFALNNTGESDASETRSFTTSDGIPTKAKLIEPDDNSTDQDTIMVFGWEDIEDTENYRFQLSIDSSFNDLVTDSLLTSLTLENLILEYSTTYFWRVRGENDQGLGEWAESSFSTGDPVPETPDLIAPLNNQAEVERQLTLVWNSKAFTQSYTYQLSEDDEFGEISFEGAISDTTVTLSGLDLETHYYWRIKAANSTGDSDWSEVRAFTTIVTDQSIPSLLTPINEAENLDTTLTLDWSEPENADEYQLQLSKDDSFASLIVDLGELNESNSEISALELSTTYYWRVRAVSGQDTSDWSNTYHFTTKMEIPEIPILLAPEDNETETDTAVVLTWNHSPRADSFTVELLLDDDVIFDDTGEDTTAIVTGLLHDTEYEWRVKSSNSTGESDWSSFFSFTTKQEDNDPPLVIHALGEILLEEDFSQESAGALNEVFSDPEGELLSFEIVRFDTLLFTANIENDTLRLASVQDMYGTGNVVIKASDNKNQEVFDTLKVEILSVNDLPQITGLADTLTFRNDEELTFGLDTSVTDVEDQLSDMQAKLSVQPNDIIAEFDEDDWTITLTASDFEGEGSLTITVTDSENGKAQATIVVVVEMETSNELDSGIPDQFALLQNYPNPFNPTSQIRFDLPYAAEVKIEVYSMLGQKVATLTDRRYNAGKHKVNFEAAALSSGIYIYRILAGSFVQTKKMTLVK
ncbi:MAG: T9SS type A sorting domain-containing protein [Balneolaceae bacterium]